MTRIVFITTLLLTMACSNKKENEAPTSKQTPIDLITALDTKQKPLNVVRRTNKNAPFRLLEMRRFIFL